MTDDPITRNVPPADHQRGVDLQTITDVATIASAVITPAVTVWAASKSQTPPPGKHE